MTLAVAEALNPNKPETVHIVVTLMPRHHALHQGLSGSVCID